MKQFIFGGLLALAGLFTCISCDKETIIDENGLPGNAASFISTHFSGIEVIQVVKDVDGFKKTFDVRLKNGTELEFKRDGSIKSIKGTGKLPDSAIPDKILTYVKTNYADHSIVEWELDDNRQEVKLSNGMELVFDKNGNFLRID
jgi:hypothetical protein